MNNEPSAAGRASRPLAWPLACAAALGLAVGATVVSRPAPVAAQSPAAGAVAAGPAGRYRVVAVPRDANPYMILVDTQTGHTWTASAVDNGGGWSDRGAPPANAK